MSFVFFLLLVSVRLWSISGSASSISVLVYSGKCFRTLVFRDLTFQVEFGSGFRDVLFLSLLGDRLMLLKCVETTKQ